MQESELFQRYVRRIASDFDMPCLTAEDEKQIFEMLADLPSWNLKMTAPKSSRWFAWAEAADACLGEWWASRMLLEFYYGADSEVHPDDMEIDAKTWQQLRQTAGGLKLAYIVTSKQNWENVHILLECQRPLWSWYTDQVQNVKAPSDGMEYAVSMASGWMRDRQLVELLQLLTVHSKGTFEKVVYWTDDQDYLSLKLFNYMLSLVGNRASSLARHGAPPLCYAGSFNDGGDTSQMKSDWGIFCALEKSPAPLANKLAEDLRLVLTPPTRLMLQAFESVGWRAENCNAGVELLHTLLFGFPDAKVVEDAHQRVRMVQKKNGHEKLRLSEVQMVLNQAGVLESRGIEHFGALSKESFLSDFRITPDSFKTREICSPKSHQLPKDCGKIMGKVKDWPTISEVTLSHSFAGWEWARYYASEKLKDHGVSLKD